MDTICGMIEEDQGITLKALKERILVDFQLNVAISTIHNYVEGRLLTLKKVHYIAADANNARNKPCAWNMCKQSMPICRTTRQLSGSTKRTLTCTVGARKEELQLASELQSLCWDPRVPMSMHVISAITNF